MLLRAKKRGTTSTILILFINANDTAYTTIKFLIYAAPKLPSELIIQDSFTSRILSDGF